MNWHVLSEANSEVIAATLWYDEQRLGLGDEFLVELQNTYEIIKRQLGTVTPPGKVYWPSRDSPLPVTTISVCRHRSLPRR